MRTLSRDLLTIARPLRSRLVTNTSTGTLDLVRSAEAVPRETVRLVVRRPPPGIWKARVPRVIRMGVPPGRRTAAAVRSFTLPEQMLPRGQRSWNRTTRPALRVALPLTRPTRGGTATP